MFVFGNIRTYYGLCFASAELEAYEYMYLEENVSVFGAVLFSGHSILALELALIVNSFATGYSTN